MNPRLPSRTRDGALRDDPARKRGSGAFTRRSLPFVRWASAGLLTLTACATLRSWAPDDRKPYTVIVSTLVEAPSSSEGAESGDSSSGLVHFPDTLRAVAEEPLPESSRNRIQALAVARAAARRKALRDLGRQILELPTVEGPALGKSLPAEGQWRAPLEQALERSARSEVTELETGIRLEAQLAGSDVLAALNPYLPAPTRRRETPARDPALDRAREEAVVRAMGEARRLLLEQILAAAAEGGTVRDRVEADPFARRRLEALIDGLAPAEIEFTPEGLCVVTLAVRRSDVERAMRE